MRRLSRLIGLSGALIAIGWSAIGDASPIGTPPANQVPTGKGTRLGSLFDDMVGGHQDDRQTTEAGGEQSKPVRKHLTAAEWRAAYIATHGHDLPSLAHPGH